MQLRKRWSSDMPREAEGPGMLGRSKGCVYECSEGFKTREEYWCRRGCTEGFTEGDSNVRARKQWSS